MMRIVFGIDDARRWETAARLLTRIAFREGVVDTMQFCEPPLYYLEALDAKIAASEKAERASKAHAEEQQMVDMASARLRRDGVVTGISTVASGSAVKGLMEYADRMKAGLIAVGSTGKSTMGAFWTGSVGRGLLIAAHQSVLIGRGETAHSGPIRAVFATDHSPYANSCLQTLLQLDPLGISHLTVLTVYPKHMIEGMQPYLPDFKLNPTQWIEEGLEKRNQAAAQKLSSLGCTFDSQVMGGDVHDAIKTVMQNAKADLLILGAQGHGFFDRLSMGSVSFRECMAEPHSVLMLRAGSSDFPRNGNWET